MAATVEMAQLMEITGLEAEEADRLLAECDHVFDVALNLHYDRLSAGRWLPPPPPAAPSMPSPTEAVRSASPPLVEEDALDRTNAIALFFHAVEHNDLDGLCELLQRSPLVRRHISHVVRASERAAEAEGEEAERTEDEWPLLIAARDGFYEVASLLLEHGSPVDVPLSLGGDQNEDLMIDTPLTWAAEECNYEMMELLLYHGASVHRHHPDHSSALRTLLDQESSQVPSEAVRKQCISLLKYHQRQGRGPGDAECGCEWHAWNAWVGGLDPEATRAPGAHATLATLAASDGDYHLHPDLSFGDGGNGLAYDVYGPPPRARDPPPASHSPADHAASDAPSDLSDAITADSAAATNAAAAPTKAPREASRAEEGPVCPPIPVAPSAKALGKRKMMY